MGDVAEDSHPSAVGEECDVRSHHDHNSLEESVEESAHGSEHEGCSHEEGEDACHSHQQADIRDAEASETGMDHGRDAPPEFGSGYNQQSFSKAGTRFVYIRNAGYSGAFELTAVKLLDSHFEISGRLEFNEASS